MLMRFKSLFSRPASAPTSEDLLRDDILQDGLSPSADAIDAPAEFVRLVATP
ncbi:hypothetical protein [Ralstonia edaphi]|uniref:hypothetical protein n=1 Tax=Ralstonia edaphi TaxID=3058599 RepID=UPI002930AF66|nr:hypothetical protein [Ralstonia sp. LMG 6871]